MSQITREQMLQVFENRCSTRYYDPNKKISQEDFAAILEFARYRQALLVLSRGSS